MEISQTFVAFSEDMNFNFSYILPGKTSVSSASSSSSSDSSSSPSEKNNDFANFCFCLVSLPFLLLRIRVLPPPLLVPLENFFAVFVGDPENFEINYLLKPHQGIDGPFI